MKVVERPSLKGMNSFGVEASAGLLITIESEEDVLSLPAFNPTRDLVLGGGSNVVFASDVPGTVFHNRILGRTIIEDSAEQAVLEIGAGENWHQLVRWSLDRGLSGPREPEPDPRPGGRGTDSEYRGLRRRAFFCAPGSNRLGLAEVSLGLLRVRRLPTWVTATACSNPPPLIVTW